MTWKKKNTKITDISIRKEMKSLPKQVFSRHKYSISARKYKDSYPYINLKAEMSQKEKETKEFSQSIKFI